MKNPFPADDNYKKHLDIKKLESDLEPKGINWAVWIPILISFGLFVLSCLQFYYARVDNAEQINRMNTIEQRVQDLEKKLEAIEESNFCHSCENR